MNGRFAGGGMPFSPACLMNDGLLDVAFYNQHIKGHQIMGILYDMKAKNGINAYDPNWTHLRGQKIVMENLNYMPNSTTELQEQMFQVDGEGLTFRRKVSMDVKPEAFELIVDFDNLMLQTGLMMPKL